MPQRMRADIPEVGRFPDGLEGLGNALNRLALPFDDRML